MAITVYTYNDKVLKNVATDKWLKKKEAPAGFVMNASNAEYIESTLNPGNYWVYWKSPTYPNAYNGDGKQYTLVNNNATVHRSDPLMYASTALTGGPNAISAADMIPLGTSTGTLINNEAAGAGYGVYFLWPSDLPSLEAAQAYIANVTITIVDP